MSSKIDNKNKLQEIQNEIQKDINAVDMKLSLLVASAANYRWDSCCVPFPQRYKDNKTGQKDIDGLLGVIEKIPNLIEILIKPQVQLETDVIELLYWLLIELNGPKLRCIPKEEFNTVLSKAPQEMFCKLPTQIFAVEYCDTSCSELRFQSHAKDFTTSYAFHGSKLFNFYNILHQGLQQHLSKNALFGEGLYLSSELNVSLPYSRNGLGWTKSVIGDTMACLALCEFVEHPIFSKHCSKGTLHTFFFSNTTLI